MLRLISTGSWRIFTLVRFFITKHSTHRNGLIQLGSSTSYQCGTLNVYSNTDDNNGYTLIYCTTGQLPSAVYFTPPSTTTPPPPPPPPPPNNGWIAGAVIGAVAGVALIGGLAWWLLRRRQKKKAAASPAANLNPQPPPESTNIPGQAVTQASPGVSYAYAGVKGTQPSSQMSSPEMSSPPPPFSYPSDPSRPSPSWPVYAPPQQSQWQPPPPASELPTRQYGEPAELGGGRSTSQYM